MTLIELFGVLARGITLSFSGFGSVPLIQEELVRQGWLTNDQLTTAIAISQVTPGPLGLYAVSVGYFVSGLSGAVVGVLALGLPSMLGVWVERALAFAASDRMKRAVAAIVISAGTLLAVSAGELFLAIPQRRLALIAVAIGATLIAITRVAPLWIVLATVAAYVSLGSPIF